MITVSYTTIKNEKYTAVEKLRMEIGSEDATKDQLMQAFQQFLSGIGYVFTVEELGEYE
jgi:hypothetical protein